MVDNFKTVQQISNDMVQEIESRSDNINVIGSGSIIKTILDAISAEIGYAHVLLRTLANFFYVQVAKGPWLDARGYDWGLQRNRQTYANGIIRITRQNTSDILVINQGTVFTNNNNPNDYTKDYFLDENIVFNVGENEKTGIIKCTRPGTIGNIEQNTIIYSKRPLTGIIDITNPEPLSNGVDEENDTSFRNRINEKMLGLQSARKESIISKVKSIPGIDFVFVTDSPVEGGVGFTYINNKKGNLSTSLLQEANDIVASDKAHGVLSIVARTPVSRIPVYVKIKKKNTLLSDDVIISRLKTEIIKYMESIPPSTSLHISQLIAFIETVPGVDYIVIEDDSVQVKLNNSYSDYETSSDFELVRTIDDLITIDILEEELIES